MKREKIIRFLLKGNDQVVITHGYNISNNFPAHFHQSYVLGIIEQGNRRMYYRGKYHTLNTGDIFIIQAGELHEDCSSGDSCHDYKMLTFPLDGNPFFSTLKLEDEPLKTCLQKFHAVTKYEADAVLDLFAKIKALLLQYQSSVMHALSENTSTQSMYKAKVYIEKHCLKNVQVKVFADKACMSEFHFSRLFLKTFGFPPYTYLTLCRMKFAERNALKQKSMTDFSYILGFYDQSHFSRQFKKYVGVSPGKFVRDNRTNSFT